MTATNYYELRNAAKKFFAEVMAIHGDDAADARTIEALRTALVDSDHASCDCTKYNGGQCYNCLNGGHDICDSGRGRCSRTPARKETT